MISFKITAGIPIHLTNGLELICYIVLSAEAILL